MYRGRLWTMRQYAGFGTARGIQRALPLPARAGADRAFGRLRSADADGARLRTIALARGEVGRVGVAIASLDDMRVLLDGLPLDESPRR